MRTLNPLAIAMWASLSLASAGTCLAAEISPVPFVGVWTGGAYSNDQTHQFSHCAATASYRSGINMTVAVGRNYNWSIGFSDESWNLKPGQDIPLVLNFDGQSQFAVTGRALTSQLVGVLMTGGQALISAFRDGHTMIVEAAGHTYGFNLNGTSRLLPQLVQCVRTQADEESSRSASSSSLPAPIGTRNLPSRASTPDAGLELSAIRIASNLLLTAKLPNARLLPPADTPPALRGRGVAWTSDAGVGAVEILPNASFHGADEVASSLITSDGKACKGDFVSGRSSDLVDNKIVTRAFTGCKDSQSTTALRYFIVQAANSDYIVYMLTGNFASASPPAGSPLTNSAFQAAAVNVAYSFK